MSMFNIFNISGSAMSAQSVRLNTVASNLANANTTSKTEEGAYRSKQVIFETSSDMDISMDGVSDGVQVKGVVESTAPVQRRYEPGNPLADEDGYVYGSNVDTAEELANLISASRSYETNVEVLNTSKQLLLSTLRLGK